MAAPLSNPNRRVNGEYYLDERFAELLTAVERLPGSGYSGIVAPLEWRPLRTGESPGVSHGVRLYRPIYDGLYYNPQDPPMYPSRFIIAKTDFPALEQGDLAGALFVVTDGPDEGLTALAASSGLISLGTDLEPDADGPYWSLDIDAEHPFLEISESDTVVIAEEMTEVFAEPASNVQFRVDYIDGWVQVTDDYEAADVFYAWYYRASLLLRAAHFINSSAGAADARKIPLLNNSGVLDSSLLGDSHTGNWSVSGNVSAGGTMSAVGNVTSQASVGATLDVAAGRDVTAGRRLSVTEYAIINQWLRATGGVDVNSNTNKSTFGSAQNIELWFDGTDFHMVNKSGGSAGFITENLRPRLADTFSLGKSDAAWLAGYIKSVYAGTKVQTAQLELGSGGPQILGGNTNPQSGGGVAAPVGSLYLRDSSGGGRLYIKFDSGNTDWYEINRGLVRAMYSLTSSWSVPEDDSGDAKTGVIVYDTLIADDPGTNRYSVTTGRFTFGKAGYFQVSAAAYLQGSGSPTTGTVVLWIYRTGAAHRLLGAVSAPGDAAYGFIAGSAMVQSEDSDDYIEIRLTTANGGAVGDINVAGNEDRGPAACHFSVQEVPSP